MKKKIVLSLFGVLFLIVLFSNINMVNAEILRMNRGKYEPMNGNRVDIEAVGGEWVWWSFETYEEKFMVNVTLYNDLDEPTPISEGKTEDSGGIFMTSGGSYILRFMNFDVHTGYMEIFVGLDEVEPEETVSVTLDDKHEVYDKFGVLKIDCEVTGLVFTVKLELYHRDTFITTICDELYVPYNDYYWSLSGKEGIFSGDRFRIKITDNHNSDVYSFSDYFTIDIGEEPEPEPEPEPSKQKINIVPIILIISIIPAIIVLGVAIFLIHNHRKKKLKEVIVKADEKPRVQEKKVPKITHCPMCGAKIKDKTVKYCSECGTKLN